MTDAPERIWVAAWREGDWREGDWDDNEGKTLNDKPCIEYVRADRIEALTAKLATCEKYRDAYDEMGRIGTQAVRDLEAKLAKAVEGLEKIAGAADREWTTARCGGLCDIARATLAEIKGESHD
jgi:hypothetical protein